MNLQHVNVKIFVCSETPVELEPFIDVFHRWVSAQSFSDMLIDVVDYRHVKMGPGVLLVGLEADYGMDEAENRIGLLYNRKAPLEGSNHDRMRHSLQSAAKACLLLETEFDGLKFNRREFEININDRALAPQTDDSRDTFQTELETFLRERLGISEFEIEPAQDVRRRVGALVKLVDPIEFEELTDENSNG
jgi:hypothetical protein